jgi:hypothetical protein
MSGILMAIASVLGFESAHVPVANHDQNNTVVYYPGVIAAVVDVGSKHPVGEHFWITDEQWIGFADDALHADDLRVGGSVDTDGSVRVLRVDGGVATVVLARPVPHGASAAHGAIFNIPVAKIQEWPLMRAERAAQQAKRDADLAVLGKVTAG